MLYDPNYDLFLKLYIQLVPKTVTRRQPRLQDADYGCLMATVTRRLSRITGPWRILSNTPFKSPFTVLDSNPSSLTQSAQSPSLISRHTLTMHRIYR